MIVPTLCVGMPPVTLCVKPSERTQSVRGCIPTQSVGTIDPPTIETESHYKAN